MPLLFAAATLAVKLSIQRTSLDLLDSLPIVVSVQNLGSAPQTARFPAPTEYRVDLNTADGTFLWSSLPSPPPAAVPEHSRTFAPGTTTLAIYDWNELLSRQDVPPAGSYVLRVRLLTDGTQPESSVRVRFSAPLSPSAVPSLPLGREYTLSGMLDAAEQTISDDRGGAALSHRLAGAPVGVPLVVRGAVSIARDGTRTFEVYRWARLGLGPQAVSSP